MCGRFAFHSEKLVRFFQNDSEGREGKLLGDEIQNISCAREWSRIPSCSLFRKSVTTDLLPRSALDVYKQTDFHAQNTLVRCIALQIFTFSLALVVVLRNRSRSY